MGHSNSIITGLLLKPLNKVHRPVSERYQHVGGIVLAHVCTPAGVRALNLGLVYITPLLKVTQPAKQQPHRRTVAADRSIIGCRQDALPNQRAVTDRRVSARGQTTQFSCTHSARIKLSINKAPMTIVPLTIKTRVRLLALINPN